MERKKVNSNNRDVSNIPKKAFKIANLHECSPPKLDFDKFKQ
jgi:hypothetical protein